jgi:predicted RNase H-like nuclease (RuvC/YqgF family)
VNYKPNVSSGISSGNNNDRILNFDNSKSNLETENKFLRKSLELKEKEIFQKDKIIKDLQEKISKLEIENINLKRQCKQNKLQNKNKNKFNKKTFFKLSFKIVINYDH